MTSMQQPLPDAAAIRGADEQIIRLPVHGTTVTAEDLKVSFVLADDFGDETFVDASQVESVGQAVLQVLVAASREARGAGKQFHITNPSPAFVDRVTSAQLADAIGLERDSGEQQ